MPTDKPGDNFELELRDVWKQLTQSIMRSRTAFESFGAAIRDPDSPDDGQLARSAESYEWEESRAHESATESLGRLLENAQKGRRTALLSAAWRAVGDLEHIAECGRRGWTLAIRESEGKYAFSDEARKDAEKLSGHLEELFYWTLEAMRLRCGDGEGQQPEAGAIAKKEGEIARRILDKTAAECAKGHEARSADGSCAIPGGVAFLDYIATVSRVARHLSTLLELSGL
ncbi:MAG: hypothetical protein LBS30_00610 [Planctomycetota bacterium]|jgi:Na+/phosphate symporter|nr:hypothetical protein [Planctomycetota bacterium]